MKDINTDLAAGGLGLGLSIVFWLSIDEEIMRLSIMFPKAMIAIMALVSTALLVKGFLKGERQDLFTVGSNRRVLATSLFFFIWGIAIPYIGFFVASVTVIFLLAAYLAVARRRLGPGVLAAWLVVVFCEVAFFYLIFTRLLHVPLPEGLFL